jgi:hypothetical protein
VGNPGGGGGGGLYGGGGGGGGDHFEGVGGGGGGGSSGFGARATNASVGIDTTGTPAITFTFLPVLTISRGGSGFGTVTSTDGQINCGPTCSHGYNLGTSVTLKATPASGSTFSGWANGGCSGTAQCSITSSSDQTVTATFEAFPNTKLLKAKVKSNAGTASFAFKSTGPSTGFQCALPKPHKKPKFKACKSPKIYKHLGSGQYIFEVRAVGAAGSDPSPAKKKFNIA